MKKRRKKGQLGGGGLSSSTGTSKRASASSGRTPSEGLQKRNRSSLSRPSSGGRSADDWGSANVVNHDVDVSAAFHITITSAGAQPQAQWGSPPGSTASGRQSASLPSPPRNVRLHGRPLSLLSALLSIASGKTYGNVKRRVVIVDDVDLDQLVGVGLRARIGTGYSQLRTFHPHLQPLADLFSILRETPRDPCVQLLLATALFVASLSLGPDPEAQRLRDELAPTIENLQHNVLAHQPSSFHAIQALELLGLHAPLSPALPLQLTDPTALGAARGVIGVALNIANSLNFDAMVNGPLERWPNPDFWLWLGLHAGEAQMAFEDERPRKPQKLGEARALTWALTSPENDQQWVSAASIDDPAELLGKLVVSDRLARLEELHDSYNRLRGILDNVTTTVNFGAQQAIQEEVDFYNSRLAEVDRRHDNILGMLSLPSSLEAGWKAYRVIRRHWEVMKVYLVAFQTLIALHYLPGSIHALSGLPTHFPAAQAIHYAFSRANNPHDILLAFASTTMAADDIRRLSQFRGAQAERLINAFVEFAPSLVASMGGADLVPLHDIMAMVVESSKTLMEQHASRLTYYRSVMALPSSIPVPPWVASLSQASQILRGLSNLRMDHEDNLGSGECVANGCSNLLGSMVRIVLEWSNMVERDGGLGIPVLPQLAALRIQPPTQPPGFRLGLPETQSPPTIPGSEAAVPTEMPMRSASTGFQSYMPSSDRWMAVERSMSLPPQTATSLSTPVLAPEYIPHMTPVGEYAPPFTDMFSFTYTGLPGTSQQQQLPHSHHPPPSSPFDPRGQMAVQHHLHGQLAPQLGAPQQPQQPHRPTPTPGAAGPSPQFMPQPHGYDESA
ncbi:hypothetical protein CspeluHIS016_0403300 [Cutaneotrichosporon spelunceum]|uniref:Uncharacterized protein n=1 Tax=Cutaneotrichosporon spelunceum TaxID=1672016 RepID=A0AAD3TVU6_9TREE|nr:hypothetical protein CspeluHIS016_0403300 [Cutaneotrichosporon spelunceum]